MADLSNMGAGAQRIAQTLLFGAGGQAVMLRVPVAAVAGVLGEQLGMPTASTSDLELAPVVVRPMAGTSVRGSRWELLAGATAVAVLAGDETVETALGMFSSAVGVVLQGELFRIAGVTYRTMGESVYLFRLELVGALSASV